MKNARRVALLFTGRISYVDITPRRSWSGQPGFHCHFWFTYKKMRRRKGKWKQSKSRKKHISLCVRFRCFCLFLRLYAHVECKLIFNLVWPTKIKNKVIHQRLPRYYIPNIPRDDSNSQRETLSFFLALLDVHCSLCFSSLRLVSGLNNYFFYLITAMSNTAYTVSLWKQIWFRFVLQVNGNPAYDVCMRAKSSRTQRQGTQTAA